MSPKPMVPGPSLPAPRPPVSQGRRESATGSTRLVCPSCASGEHLAVRETHTCTLTSIRRVASGHPPYRIDYASHSDRDAKIVELYCLRCTWHVVVDADEPDPWRLLREAGEPG